MTEHNDDIRLLPSILDRLIDDQPNQKAESPVGRTQLLQQMKRSVGRDLQNLLNTRCRATSYPDSLTQLDRSLMAYGIPDCVGINTGSREQQEEMKETIQKVVETFEPRLMNVNVSLEPTDDPADRTLNFRIGAMLIVDPVPEPVSYNSHLDATVGNFQIQGVA